MFYLKFVITKRKIFSCILLAGIFGGTALNLRLNSQNELSSNLTLDQLNAFSACEAGTENNGDDVYITVLCNKRSTSSGSQNGNYCTQPGSMCAYTSNGGGV
jgi:hypothetical protein